MNDSPVHFDQLAGADLVVDRVYKGGSAKNAADDPISRLVSVGNQGGFRYRGSVASATVRLVVLYTSGVDPDWPDELDPATGDFTYYGDNKQPGRGLHETRRGGNLLLREMFAAARGDSLERRTVPPILLFQKGASGRDVVFRGLLAPGSPRLRADEELVAVWRTTADRRFQNYRSHFTVLKTPVVTQAWLAEVVAGETLGAACPAEWRAWVQGRIYQALEAPRTVSVRSRAEQLPDMKDQWILQAIHQHFAASPIAFEHMAADLWLASEPRVRVVEVTRPSRDGGRDAIGTLELGPLADPIRLEFALEAKCYEPSRGIGVKPVSRLISRIKHREFGVFVTTSFIAQQAYEEVRTDQHPIVFITGRDIARVIRALGINSPEELMGYLKAKYPLPDGNAEGVENVRVDPFHPESPGAVDVVLDEREPLSASMVKDA